MKKYLLLLALLAAAPASYADICGKAGVIIGGAVATEKAMVTAVAHSSGKLILRSAAGYIAGTLGPVATFAGPLGWVLLGASGAYIVYDCVSEK